MTTPRYLLSALAFLILMASGGRSMAQQEPRQVVVDGVSLAYTEAGHGDPVIFVHGGLQDYRMWTEHLPQFADHYRVLTYSRRNNFPNEVSASGAPDGAADLHGADLAAFIQALGLHRVRIVAHSSGAHAALFFAAAHPEQVISLVLNEPPAIGLIAADPNSASLLSDWVGKMKLARKGLTSDRPESAIPEIVDAIGGPGAYERRSAADKKMNADNVASYQADATAKRGRVPFTCEMAKSIRAPVLLTNGSRSPEFFHRIADRLASCLPVCERATVEGSSHTVPSEQRAAFDRLAVDFLARH